MGAIRFLLAYMVLLSHLGITFFKLNLGVSAVVIFYLLSGNVVANLWGQFQTQPNGLKLFFFDRAWRILPQYFLALFCAIALWIKGVDSTFISATPDILDWLFNITLIPLNFFMLTGREHFILVPPAWSLAAECQFYLIAPFIVSAKPKFFLSWLFISMSVFVLAQCNYIDMQIYGYRLLPGMLFIFLMGAMLTKKMHVWKTQMLTIVWAITIIYFVWLNESQIYQPYNQEVALGLMFGIPLLRWRNKVQTFHHHANLTQSKMIAWVKLSKVMGYLSYGVFLYHFLAIWWLAITPYNVSYISVIKVSLITAIMSVFGHYIFEKPIWSKMRHRIIN